MLVNKLRDHRIQPIREVVTVTFFSNFNSFSETLQNFQNLDLLFEINTELELMKENDCSVCQKSI